MDGHTFLAKVSAPDCETELDAVRFMFVTFADDHSTVVHTSDILSAEEMETLLAEMGVPREGVNGIRSRMEEAPRLC